MLALMADNDVASHVEILLNILASAPWYEIVLDLDVCRSLPSPIGNASLPTGTTLIEPRSGCWNISSTSTSTAARAGCIFRESAIPAGKQVPDLSRKSLTYGRPFRLNTRTACA